MKAIGRNVLKTLFYFYLKINHENTVGIDFLLLKKHQQCFYNNYRYIDSC